MSTEQNKAAVRAFLTLFEKLEIDELMSMLHDDLVWWINGRSHLFPGAGTKTKADAAEAFSGAGVLFEHGLKMTPTNMVAEDDQVAVEIESYGVAQNEKIYNNNYSFVFKFKDSKISVMREYFDTAQIMEILS